MGDLAAKQDKETSFLFSSRKIQKCKDCLQLAEEATNNDPWGPDARTMTKISEASFNMNDYWRIVYVLHKRLDHIDWRHWRQSYKTLTLLEFLLTHGPTTVAEEFLCDSEVIEELGTFTHVDENG
ncbi:hypothetical protein CXB51_025790 [Gossypium anomalum]|uniref:ENTH domain-containing protein n=1 Tax=Gossypium anomalum TaxID=47600 RepID=A0A8J5Y3K4_9ROSI|nr:hypothetical protein CXB51_025790 [Gossypium anomalum]